MTAALIVGLATSAVAGSFAGAVVSYDAGSTPATQWPSFDPYDMPGSALGKPDGITGEEGTFGTSMLTPFSAADERAEIVSVGEGGHLTLQLENYCVIGAGPDLGVIGNAALVDTAWPKGVAGDPVTTFGADPVVIEVSQDGSAWTSLGAVMVDMPGNYYANATDAADFPTSGYNADPPVPAVLADFGKPFTPAGGLSDFAGKDFDEILTLLDGSGGGTWLDLSGTGLSHVGYVRFSVADDGDTGTGLNFELDAVSIANGKVGGPVGGGDVPVAEPGSAALILLGGLIGLRRGRSG
jgi:hypothetical protein